MEEALDIKALQEAKAQIDAQIEQARKLARDGAITQIIGIMAEAGITPADLGFTPPAAKVKAKRVKSTREPKYRDPESGQSWVGRGKRPDWLVHALAGGRSLDSFAVQATQ
jgi:DNA-binding protein H-NS